VMTTGAGAAERILVPLDGSADALAALPYAQALATPGTELILLTVVPVADEVIAGTGQMLVPADQMSAIEEERARASIEPVAEGLRQAGHAVSVACAVGDPATRILDIAAERGVGTIVMASRGRGALGRLVYGSVADRVAREATVPTMVIRAAQREPGPVGITRLVVPLDGTLLAEEALDVAAAISRRLGTPIFLVRAVNPAEMMTPGIGMAEVIPVELYQETEQEMEEGARAYLEEVAARLRADGLPVATRVLSGPPATAIEEATQLGDVTVLRSHERSGVMRWLVGSVAEKLVREDESPVILVPGAESGDTNAR
jgi:nucleotide-binding universal stress UspA family protein